MTNTSGKPAGQSLTAGFKYAFRGILHVIRYERHMWIHMGVAFVVVAAGAIFHLARSEWILIALCMGLVFSAEIMNTAIERIVDLLSPEKQKLAGQVKDLAAGAVLVCALTAAVIGLIIFVPHIME